MDRLDTPETLDDARVLESFGITDALIQHLKPKCYLYDWYRNEIDQSTACNAEGMDEDKCDVYDRRLGFEIVPVNSAVKVRTLPDDYPLIHVMSSRPLPDDYFTVERLQRLFVNQYTRSLKKFRPHISETDLASYAEASRDVFFVRHLIPHLRCTTDRQFRRLVDNLVCYVFMNQGGRMVVTSDTVEKFAASPLVPVPIVYRAAMDLGDSTYTATQMNVLSALPTQDRYVNASRLDVCTAIISLIQHHAVRLTKKVAPASRTLVGDETVDRSNGDFSELVSSWPQSCVPEFMEQNYSLPKSVRSLNVNVLLEAVDLISS